MKRIAIFPGILSAALLGMYISPQLQAMTIHYSDMVGTDVTYTDISEDTRDEPAALFGAPEVVGNRLDFDPLNFTAQVSSQTGTNNSEIVDGQLNFTVMSLDDAFGIERLLIGEAGDFTLAGLGNAMAGVAVAAPIHWTITHVDGALLMDPVSGQIDMVFTPSDAYSLPNDTGGSWSGSAVIDIAGQLADAMVDGLATKVEVVLDNTLSASAADGGSAFIAKKEFNGLTITIPEPASAALLVWGLLGLWASRRRA